jgi:hypothetical protein
MVKPSFDYSQDFGKINVREQPELYQIGRGEQGVLSVEPYKSEILPFWRFKDPETALESSQKIYQLFLNYLEQDDFVGADMARKFLQMGYTRARRYANYPGGKKYATNPQKAPNPKAVQAARRNILPRHHDPIKAEAAQIFKNVWEQAKKHSKYQTLKEEHRRKYSTP